MRIYNFAKILLFINFVFTLHYAISTYINSSFLETILPTKYVGVLFTISAIIALAVLSRAERLLITFSDYKVTVVILLLDIVALSGLALTFFADLNIPRIILALLFIMHHVTAFFLLRFTLDEHFEEHMEDGSTGLRRGKLLTASNFAWVISPIAFATLLGDSDFGKIYFVSMLFAIALLVAILIHYPKEPSPRYKKIYYVETLKLLAQRKNLLRIFLASFLMYFFFAWMIIYLPIHLHTNIGFSWETIGKIFIIMLIPYLLIDIPAGFLADKYFGEKEMLSVGFLFAAIFTIPIAFISSTSLALWAFILVGTRIGAGLIEVMTEVYFFKHVNAEEGNFISLFRQSAPLAYLIAPLLGSVILALTNGFTQEPLFLILGIIMLSGLFVSIPLKDTK